MKNYLLITLLVTNISTSVAQVVNEEPFIAKILHYVVNIAGSTIWNLDSNGIAEFTSPLDRLGESVSHGDYNNDGIQDLAIGIPNYDFGPLNNVGTVLIIYGSPNGLSSNDQFLFQTFESDPANLEDINGIEENDFFGKSLTSGDFNCDGITDLAVGTPEEDLNITSSGAARENVGAINIFYGSLDGFTAFGQDSTFFFQGTELESSLLFTEENDRFGWSMTVGDFDGDGCDDLAVSAPFEDLGIEGQITDAGQVEVYYGRTSGLSGHPNVRDSLNQQSDGMGETLAENHDQFGYSLAAGRLTLFGGIGVFDLVVGIPGENVNDEDNAGAIQVFKGSTAGINEGAPSEIWSQAGAIIGLVERNDRFGSSVTVGNFNGDSIDDLVIGVPRENSSRGAFHILYGSADGITTNDSIFEKNLGDGEALDQMGYAMTIADFGNGNQLAVGIPGDNSSDGDNDSGSIEVFEFSQSDLIFKNNFESIFYSEVNV